jgi:hypothetical protein
MTNTLELVREPELQIVNPKKSSLVSLDVVANAEKIFHRLQEPVHLRAKLGEILDIARERLDQLILTPAERQTAQMAHGNLTQFLQGNLVDRGQIMLNTRNLTAVVGKAGDIPLSRAISAGINALVKRQLAH